MQELGDKWKKPQPVSGLVLWTPEVKKEHYLNL